MPSKAHAPLRAAIVHMLEHNDALNKLFLIDKLADMCNIAAGLDGEGIHVTTLEVSRAFEKSMDVTPINAMGVDTDHVLRYQRDRPSINDPFITSVGRFVSNDVTVGKPLTKTVRVTMADDVKCSLKKFLQKREEAKKKRKAADETAKKDSKKKKKKKANSMKVEDDKEKERRELEEKKRREMEEEKLEAEQQKLLKDAIKQFKAKQEANEKLGMIRERLAALDRSLSVLGSTSTRPSPIEVEEDGRRLYYILDGRAGFVHYPDGVACVLDQDIRDGLQELPEGYGDDYDNNQVRRGRAYELRNFGATQFFVPKGATAVANNHQVRKESSHVKHHNLQALFSGDQSNFGEDALRIAAAFNAQGYGASDEATEMIIVGWTKALLKELGIEDIDASSIANGCPSRRTHVRNEARLAADCMIVVLQEIIDDEAKCIAALVSKTNVGEVRRTMRAIILSTIIRPFHMWAKQELAKRNPDKKPPRRVEGQVRGELLIKYIERFCRKLNKAIQALGTERYDQIKKKLMDKNKKTSARYRNERSMEFKESLENNMRMVTKSEEALGRYDKTVLTEGGISFKLLTMVNSCNACNTFWKKRKYQDCQRDGCCLAAVHAELKHRNIGLSKQQLCGLAIAEKRKKLRTAVTSVKMVEQGQGQQGFNNNDIKYFVPETELGKSLRGKQREMMNNEKGVNT